MEIRDYQNQLFNVIDRSYMLDGTSGLPVEKGIMPMNYTKQIELLSYGNMPYETYNQLDNVTHIGTFGKQNSQKSRLPEPIIHCTPRKNETSSRFNYAIDKCIDRRMIDVSGQNIPNNMLRKIPDRGIQLCYQKRNIPSNPAILALSNKIGNISAAQLNNTFKISKGDLNFKASRQRLTKEELQGLEKLQVTNGVSVKDQISKLLDARLDEIADTPVPTPNREIVILGGQKPANEQTPKKKNRRRDTRLSGAATGKKK